MNAPKAPDPYQTAAAQTASNKATAQTQQELNMVDQNNPYGSLKYSQTGTNPDGTPKFQADTSLTGSGQQLFDAGNTLKLGQQGVASQLLHSGQGAFSGQPVDLSYNGTTAALDSLNHARLDPQWAQNSQHEADTLAARGITAGTPAYDNEMRVFNQGKNDAYNSANLADYDLSSRNALTQWGAPMQAYGQLTGMSQPTNFSPMNTPNTNVAGTNIAGLINDNYKQESANTNAQNGQLAGILGTGLGAVMGGPFGAAAGGALGGLFGSGGGVAGTMNVGGNSYPAYQ